MENPRKHGCFQNGPYKCEYTALGEGKEAMANQVLLVIRKDGDINNIPTFSGQVPLEVALWIEKMASENVEMQKVLAKFAA